MEKLINKLYEHNRWANLLLVDVCKDLNDSQLDGLDQVGVYGSIRDTLFHLTSAEGRYVWRLKGSPDPEPPRDERGFPGFDEIRRRLEQSGTELIEVARSTDGDALYQTSFDGKEYSFVANLVKIQAINHATEHRSQISTMLTQLGITPPEMDGWSFGFEAGLMKTKEEADP